MCIRTNLYSSAPEWFQQFWSPLGSTSILIEIELAPKMNHVRLCSRILFIYLFNEHASNSELYSWPFHNIQKSESKMNCAFFISQLLSFISTIWIVAMWQQTFKSKNISIVMPLFLPPPLSAKLMSCVI